MDIVSTPLAVALLVVGGAGLVVAAMVARRQPSQVRRGAGERGPWSMLVPWAGSVLVLVLLVRGALAGAVFVGLMTLGHTMLARMRATRPEPHRPEAGRDGRGGRAGSGGRGT